MATAASRHNATILAQMHQPAAPAPPPLPPTGADLALPPRANPTPRRKDHNFYGNAGSHNRTGGPFFAMHSDHPTLFVGVELGDPFTLRTDGTAPYVPLFPARQCGLLDLVG